MAELNAATVTRERSQRPLRTLCFVAGSLGVLLALAFWLTSQRSPHHTKLLILFLYSIPAEFLIATIPHEPVIFYFSKLFHPFTVTWVTLLATLFTEYLNYFLVEQAWRIPRLNDLRKHKYFMKINGYFLRAPFRTLVAAALTPIPFYPFRIIASSSNYSLKRYLGAVFVGRAPRFYVLAQFGYLVKIPNWILIVLFAVLFAASLIYHATRRVKTPSRREPADCLVGNSQRPI